MCRFMMNCYYWDLSPTGDKNYRKARTAWHADGTDDILESDLSSNKKI